MLGAAPCVHADVRRALAVGGFDAFYCVNAAVTVWPVADALVTGHPEAAERWMEARPKAWPRPKIIAWDRDGKQLRPPGVQWVEDFWDGMPRMRLTSALLACKVALDRGATRVVVAGVPLDMNGGHIDPSAPQDHNYIPFRRAFGWAQTYVFGGRVRGVSGYLAGLTGVPTREWLHG